MRSLLVLVALLVAGPASAGDPCDTPPPACPARSAAPFDPTGAARVPAGTARVYRVGDAFSTCRSEGGCSSLVIHGQSACGLWLREDPTAGLQGTEGRPAVRRVEPRADGVWEVVHVAKAFEGPDGAFDGKVRYTVRQVNAGCFEVRLETELLPYPGE